MNCFAASHFPDSSSSLYPQALTSLVDPRTYSPNKAGTQATHAPTYSSITYSQTKSGTYLPTHTPTHLLTYPPTHLPTYPPTMMTNLPKPRLNSKLKFVALAVGVAALIVVARMFNFQELLQNALAWIQGLGPSGAIAFMVIYILATVLFIPGSLLTLGGGAIFGVALGSVCVFFAAAIGATLAFLIGRYIARGWVSRQIEGNVKFQAIDRAIAREGFKIVALTRLSPVFPFNLLNYGLGVTQVSLKDYVLGFIGMIPGTVMYVYIGSLAGSLAMIGNSQTTPEAARIQWIIRIVGFIATVAVTVYVTRVAKKALDQSVNFEGESHGVTDEH